VAITADSFTHNASSPELIDHATVVSLNWRDGAACRDTDPDLFFPVGTTGAAIEQIRAAKAVCAVCPVKGPCLEFALITNQDSGVWGGTSEDERRKIRRTWVKSRRAAS
jgi:WhiB family redox-sensing transcriptional regulator